MGYFATIFKAFGGILKGMRITLLTMLKPACTVQYPDEKLVPYADFRGVLLFDAEACISCSLCVKACPSNCIQLENATNEAGKKIAKVDWYSIDFGKCNFCRLCEEACPTKAKAVWHSRDYELVFSSRDQMTRCWKKGFPYVGKTYDHAAGEFVSVVDQVPIHKVHERKGV